MGPEDIVLIVACALAGFGVIWMTMSDRNGRE